MARTISRASSPASPANSHTRARLLWNQREFNDAPGLIVRVGGEVDQAVTLSVADGQIAAIYTVRNPEKFKRLH